LAFNDVLNYVAKQSLVSFLRAFGSDVVLTGGFDGKTKKSFCYGSLTPRRLKEKFLPKYEEFQNIMTNRNTFPTEEAYELAMRDYRMNFGVSSFKDLLRVYSCADIVPLLAAMMNLKDLYRERGRSSSVAAVSIIVNFFLFRSGCL
jgi:hypothetical protein